MIAQILDHLWQSTVILCLAGLLTLLLRRNNAGARYWLWFTASAKFLIPLPLLTALSSRLMPASVVPVFAEPASGLAQKVSQPFIQVSFFRHVSPVGPAAAAAPDFRAALMIIWGVGCGVVLLSWFIRWRRIRRKITVCPSFAGFEPQRHGIRAPDAGFDGFELERIIARRLHGQPGCMAEELLNRDRLPGARALLEIHADRVMQSELSIRHQEHHPGGNNLLAE